MTALTVKTKTVTLQNGTTAVINVADFDPAQHTEASKKPTLKKKQRKN